MARLNFSTARVAYQLAEAFSSASEREIRLAGRQFAEIVKQYGERAKNASGLARTNQFLADKMREATVAAYERDVVAVRAAPTYRVGKNRYSGGALLRALESPAMAVGNSFGIAFINKGVLDRRARFWARLNFGAGAEAESGVPQPRARIQWGSNQGFSLRLSGGPRPPFQIPEYPGAIGYFLNNQFFMGSPSKAKRGQGAFLLGPPKFPKVTKGIAARRFLDAGLYALGQEFKPAYTQYLNDVRNEVVSRGRSRRV